MRQFCALLEEKKEILADRLALLRLSFIVLSHNGFIRLKQASAQAASIKLSVSLMDLFDYLFTIKILKVY